MYIIKLYIKRFLFTFQVSLSTDPLKLEAWQCSCKAGKGFCQHVIALLYQTAQYKKKGFKVVPVELSKTSTTQKWGVPKRTEGFSARPLHEVALHKVSYNSIKKGYIFPQEILKRQIFT